MILNKLPSFENLIHHLSKLPSIGHKTATRLAYHLIRQNELHVREFTEALTEAKKTIRKCPSCFSYTEEKHTCTLCLDESRSYKTLCVVEDPFDIITIESSHSFQGQYHVLHGTISPLEGVQPGDLTISELIKRVEENQVEEIILALDADLEGDTTVLYLSRIFENKSVKVTRIAHGIPMGGDIDYIDYRTLGRALENRVEIL